MTKLTVEQTRLEVAEAWRLAGLRTTTWDDFQNMIWGLAFVLLHCPEECRTSVEAAIGNAERRAVYVATRRLRSLA